MTNTAEIRETNTEVSEAVRDESEQVPNTQVFPGMIASERERASVKRDNSAKFDKDGIGIGHNSKQNPEDILIIDGVDVLIQGDCKDSIDMFKFELQENLNKYIGNKEDIKIITKLILKDYIMSVRFALDINNRVKSIDKNGYSERRKKHEDNFFRVHNRKPKPSEKYHAGDFLLEIYRDLILFRLPGLPGFVRRCDPPLYGKLSQLALRLNLELPCIIKNPIKTIFYKKT